MGNMKIEKSLNFFVTDIGITYYLIIIVIRVIVRSLTFVCLWPILGRKDRKHPMFGNVGHLSFCGHSS